MIVAALAALLTALLTAALLGRVRPRRAVVIARSLATPAPASASGAPRSTSVDHSELLDAVARRVRTGSSLTAAVIDEIDRSPPLRPTAEGLRRGGTLSAALDRVHATDPDVALMVHALSAAARLGGPVAATLDQAASVVRERSAARAERRAHSAQARLSARVMTIVPVAFAGWNVISSETARAVYLTSQAGAAVAVAGVLLNIAGWRWMKKIVGPR